MNANQSKPPAVEVREADFRTEVLQSKQPVLVEFWAPWSQPCKILESVLNEISTACG
jgi:thioredoxin 1